MARDLLWRGTRGDRALDELPEGVAGMGRIMHFTQTWNLGQLTDCEVELSPWTKSNAPGPSLNAKLSCILIWGKHTYVVPPAKEYPITEVSQQLATQDDREIHT